MDTFLFAVFAVGYTALLIWGIALAQRSGWASSGNLLLPVIVALIYDNAVLAGGQIIGEGPLLEALNGARFWLHAFLTPLLVLVAWNAMERAGVGFARARGAWLIPLAIYAALIIVDLVTEVRGLSLVPVREYGVLSYSSAEPATGPPLMILGVSLALLIASILVWWKQRWPWFFAGVLLMLVGNSVPIPVESGAITNAFEFVLLASLVLTKWHQERATDEDAQRPPRAHRVAELMNARH